MADPLGVLTTPDAPTEDTRVPSLLEGAEESAGQSFQASWRPILEISQTALDNSRRVNSDEFEQRFAVHGISPETSVTLKPGETMGENSASVISDYVRGMDQRARLIAREPGGIVTDPVNFVSGLAGSLPTPQGIAFAMLPEGAIAEAGEYGLARLGMAAAGKVLKSSLTSTFLGRTAASFSTGAAVTALLSPLDYMDNNIRGQDLTFGEGARNILYGGLTFAGAHVAGEALRVIGKYLLGDASMKARRTMNAAEVNADPAKGLPESEVEAVDKLSRESIISDFINEHGVEPTEQQITDMERERQSQLAEQRQADETAEKQQLAQPEPENIQPLSDDQVIASLKSKGVEPSGEPIPISVPPIPKAFEAAWNDWSNNTLGPARQGLEYAEHQAPEELERMQREIQSLREQTLEKFGTDDIENPYLPAIWSKAAKAGKTWDEKAGKLTSRFGEVPESPKKYSSEQIEGERQAIIKNRAAKPETLKKAAEAVTDPKTPLAEKAEKLMSGNEDLKKDLPPERVEKVKKLEDDQKQGEAAIKAFNDCIVGALSQAAGKGVADEIDMGVEKANKE